MKQEPAARPWRSTYDLGDFSSLNRGTRIIRTQALDTDAFCQRISHVEIQAGAHGPIVV